MKKVLLVTPYFHPYLSGLTVYPLELLKPLARSRRITVLTLKHQDALPDRDRHAGMDIIRLKSHLKLLKGHLNLLYPLHLIRHIRQNDAVLVVLPQLEGGLAAILARVLGKRLYAVYLCDLDLQRGLLYRAASYTATLSAFITSVLASRIITLTEDYAQNSPVLKRFLPKTVFIPPSLPKTAPASTAFLTGLRKKYRENSPVIGFVGRISQEKGLDVLLSAVDFLRDRHPDIHLLMAGPAPTEVVGEQIYGQTLVDRIEREKLPVTVLGRLDKTELAAFYKFVDILVLPSTNRTEAFGMVQTEAMLHQTPVVAPNLPGVRVPVKLTKGGLLFEPQNARDLAGKIEELTGNIANYRPSRSSLTVFSEDRTSAGLRDIL